MINMGVVSITINSVDLLEDLYINKNASLTKHVSTWRVWSKLMPNSTYLH